MPIYEYACTDCGHKFELIRPVSQFSDEVCCPSCQKPAERVLSKFACFTRDGSGMTSSLAGNSCASCGSSNCASCHM